MYISYSSSDEYSQHTGISIISLFEKNKDMDLEVFIICNNISSTNINNFKKIAKNYNRKINFINFQDIINNLDDKLPLFGGSYSTYSRILLGKIYPEYVKKILIIDSDTVVNGSLSGLDNLNMDKKIIAAVENPDFQCVQGSIEEDEIIKKNGLYFNAGIIYVNLVNWRLYNFEKRIYDSIDKIKDFSLADQTILNYTIDRDEIHRLPYKYNYWGHLWPNSIKTKKWIFYKNYFTETEIEEAEKTPIIIHYKGEYSRPWFKESISSMKSIYIHYKNISPWKDIPLQSYYEIARFIKQPKIKKIKIYLCISMYNTYIFSFYQEIKEFIKMKNKK